VSRDKERKEEKKERRGCRSRSGGGGDASSHEVSLATAGTENVGIWFLSPLKCFL